MCGNVRGVGSVENSPKQGTQLSDEEYQCQNHTMKLHRIRLHTEQNSIVTQSIEFKYISLVANYFFVETKTCFTTIRCIQE